jgi:AraC-like DNA-binding protein
MSPHFLQSQGSKMEKAIHLKETINIFRPHQIPGTEIWTIRNSSRKWAHFHSTYTFCPIFRADKGADWKYRNWRNFSTQRDIMMMEPGETHVNLTSAGNGSFFVLLIDPEFVKKSSDPEGNNTRFPRLTTSNTNHPIFFSSLSAFYRSILTKKPLLEVTSRLQQCLSIFHQRFTERPGRAEIGRLSREQLFRSRDYIIDRFSENITLSQLATVAGLSPFHFLRAFTKAFGLPPHQFQIKVRLSKALACLRSGMPISQINAGFSDQSHLTRLLSKQLGFTPGQFREWMLKRERTEV